MKLSIIIPIYNEEQNIRITIDDLIAVGNPAKGMKGGLK
jgi:glycosyltransferase involved in cell wall biosynthesis